MSALFRGVWAWIWSILGLLVSTGSGFGPCWAFSRVLGLDLAHLEPLTKAWVYAISDLFRWTGPGFGPFLLFFGGSEDEFGPFWAKLPIYRLNWYAVNRYTITGTGVEFERFLSYFTHFHPLLPTPLHISNLTPFIAIIIWWRHVAHNKARDSQLYHDTENCILLMYGWEEMFEFACSCVVRSTWMNCLPRVQVFLMISW